MNISLLILSFVPLVANIEWIGEERSVFSYHDMIPLENQIECKTDMIQLRGGKQVCGEFREALINQVFDKKPPFESEDVSTIIFSDGENGILNVSTYSGNRYLVETSIREVQLKGVPAIPFSEISFVSLKKKEKEIEIEEKHLKEKSETSETDHPFLAETDFDLEEWENEFQKGSEEEDTTIEFASYKPKDENTEIAQLEDPVDKLLKEKMDGVPSKMIAICPKDSEDCEYRLATKMVTNSEYQKFLKAIHLPPPSHWIDGKIPPGEEEAPVVNVSYKDAYLYTVWVGKRLPTVEELEHARGHEVFYFSMRKGEWTSTPVVKKQPARLDYNSGSHITPPKIITHKIFYLDGARPDQELPSSASSRVVGFRLAND